jgi:hypothetical protein
MNADRALVRAADETDKEGKELCAFSFSPTSAAIRVHLRSLPLPKKEFCLERN